MDEQFRRAGLLDRVRVAAEVNNVLVARRLVSLRLGVTILPQSAHELPFRGVATCPLDGLFPPERVVLIWRKGATPKPSAREFADLARALLVRPKPPSGKTRSIS